jgi:hypothetical protein
MTCVKKKSSRVRRGCILPLLPPLHSTSHPNHHRHHLLPVGLCAPSDSNSNSTACCSSPARRRTTTAVTTTVTGVVAVIAVVVVATAAPIRIRVQTHLGLPSSNPGPTLFICGRVLRVLDSRLCASPRP